jgi:glycosyltransferase involved in cell wall biosynthesis
MKRLSILVPVYNVEKYLSKCLDSLLDQDIPTDEYEIIIINDGSTDSSLTIAESYLNQYPNVKLYSQENKGLGAARNAGIKIAEGNCLFFVDSDDFIEVNCLKFILTCFEAKKLDILRFNYEAVNEDGALIPKKKSGTYNTIYSEKLVEGESFLTEYLGWACYVWVFLFDASFLKKNQFFFNENIFFEDVEWLIRVMLNVKRVQSIDKVIYFYLQRSGSITQSLQFEKRNKIINDKLFIIDMLNSFSQNSNNLKVRCWCNGMISLTFMSILDSVENELPQRKNEIIKLLSYQKFLPLKSYHFTLKQKRNLIIINICPKFYCYLKNNNRSNFFVWLIELWGD